jgi:hypothetical protein
MGEADMADVRSRARIGVSTGRREWVRPAVRILEAGKADFHFGVGGDSTHGAS